MNNAKTSSATSTGPTGPVATGDLSYDLQGGYVQAWLVAGPIATPVHNLGDFRGDDAKAQIARAYARPTDPAALAPAEGVKYEEVDANGTTHTLTWHISRGRDDHYVNLTGFYHNCHYLSAWAYTQIITPDAKQVDMILATSGAADVWINGEHILRHVPQRTKSTRPQSSSFQARLQQGANKVWVRFEAVAMRACPFLLALQLDPDAAATCHTSVPTARLPLARRQKLEKVFDAAYLTQSTYHRDDHLQVYWPAEMKLADKLTVRLQSRSGRIYAEAQPDVTGGTVLNLGPVYQVPDGEYNIVLMPGINEYYLQQMQIDRRIPLRIINTRHVEQPDQPGLGITEARRREVLVHAARNDTGIYAEIARITLGDWQHLRRDAFDRALERINRRGDCSDFDMVGLLGLLLRHGDDPNFPADLRAAISESVLNFKYWMDEPGDDAMCYWSENHQILFHTSQLLAGQLFPDARFSNTGQTGEWHRSKGEQRARSWLYKHATGGFQEWDSNCYFNENVLALAHLADLAADDTVAEMAAVVLDKLCFTVALNSFNGVFGSTHGRSYTGLILGGRGERTSSITRLLWGQGTLNSSITGAVGLACAQSYELPPIIAAIANDRPAQLWNRERHAGQRETWCDLDDEPWEINKVTYKTPDYMLCSAQDYRPGEPGVQQHIWQATLGPDAVVFVNHPINIYDENDLRPNFWSGNGVLPRVVQWHDTLLGIYHLPADDWLGWTHAYFPRAAFDETVEQAGWIFARKRDGYVALTAANGLHPTTRGLWADQEIRSPGLNNVWLCQMGRRAEDGDFALFIRKVCATQPHFDDLAVRLTNIRGVELAFAWQGPLFVDGAVQPVTGFRHYDNPYCQTDLPAEEMVIQFQDQQMRLDFALNISPDAQEV